MKSCHIQLKVCVKYHEKLINCRVGRSTIPAFNFSLCDEPPRSTQISNPFVHRRNEYQAKVGDALRLESKGG